MIKKILFRLSLFDMSHFLIFIEMFFMKIKDRKNIFVFIKKGKKISSKT